MKAKQLTLRVRYRMKDSHQSRRLDGITSKLNASIQKLENGILTERELEYHKVR